MMSHAPRPARRSVWILVLAFSVVATRAPAQSDRKTTRLADGVFLIEHRDRQDGFAGGNTTVIIGDRQVLVVDAPFLPSDAREDIAQIRQWTDKPVTFVLNTHFHNDHNLGNRAYVDAFPAVTIIAHRETKRDMDLFGPGSESRTHRGTAGYQQMLASGKTPDGAPLPPADIAELKQILARRNQVGEELKTNRFQSATLSFDHELEIDLGNRTVQVKFLGRGNTPGDAVAYLPTERIAVVGDLIVHPIPFFYDGYPTEWAETLQRLGQLDARSIVPGHGPVLSDRIHLELIRDLLNSAVAQVNEALRKSGPAMFRTVDDIKAGVDLTPFRVRFAGADKSLSAAFDDAAATLVKLVFREASLR